MKFKPQLDLTLEREQEAAIAPGSSIPTPKVRSEKMGSHSIFGSSLFWAFCGSLALAAIYARAALINLNYGIIGGYWDGYENAWNYYWVKTALFDLHRNPFFTDYLYYPTGISLRYHTLNPFNAFLTMPFNLTLGYVPTVNLLFVFSYFLTTLFTFLLIRDLVGNPWAAFAGAAIATYANSWVLFFYVHGQANLVAAEWMPLYFLLMLRTLHGGPNWNTTLEGDVEGDAPARKHRYRWLLYAGLSVLVLLITSLTDWQYVVFVAFVSILYFVFVLFTRRTWRAKAVIFGKLAAIGGAYAAITFPILILPMLKEVAVNPWLILADQASFLSIDLVDLIRPGLTNPGYLAMAMALVGLWTTRRGKAWEVTLFWMVVTLVFYLLALGPVLHINGQTTKIHLPYDWFQDVPGLNTSRNPRRYTIVASLGVGVLAAFGIRSLLTWLSVLFSRAVRESGIRSRESGVGNGGLIPGSLLRRHSLIAPAIVLVFLVVSLSGFMYAAGEQAIPDPPDWPKFYEHIAQDKDTYALLELPMFTRRGRGEHHYMMLQILHHKPRFSALWSRDHKLSNPNNFVKRASLFHDLLLTDYPNWQRELYYPERDFLSRTDYKSQGAAILSYYNVRYVILYKEAISQQEWPRVVGVVEEVLGSGKKPEYEDNIMRVYRVSPTPAPANPLTLDVGNGWFPADVSDSGHVYRWADGRDGQQSELYTMNLRTEPVRARLSFTAYTHKQTRTLKIAINGYEAGVLTLKPEEGQKPFSIELTIPPGNNMITFSSPERALPTDDPKDARLLNFGMYGVELKPK